MFCLKSKLWYKLVVHILMGQRLEKPVKQVGCSSSLCLSLTLCMLLWALPYLEISSHLSTTSDQVICILLSLAYYFGLLLVPHFISLTRRSHIPLWLCAVEAGEQQHHNAEAACPRCGSIWKVLHTRGHQLLGLTKSGGFCANHCHVRVKLQM